MPHHIHRTDCYFQQATECDTVALATTISQEQGWLHLAARLGTVEIDRLRCPPQEVFTILRLRGRRVPLRPHVASGMHPLDRAFRKRAK
jgi:hypothetical protein